jgi:hypothetical protein
VDCLHLNQINITKLIRTSLTQQNNHLLAASLTSYIGTKWKTANAFDSFMVIIIAWYCFYIYNFLFKIHENESTCAFSKVNILIYIFSCLFNCLYIYMVNSCTSLSFQQKFYFHFLNFAECRQDHEQKKGLSGTYRVSKSIEIAM